MCEWGPVKPSNQGSVRLGRDAGRSDPQPPPASPWAGTPAAQHDAPVLPPKAQEQAGAVPQG